MNRVPATVSAAFGELQSRLPRQFGHRTFAFLSAIRCRKAENVWPHLSHNISISSLILFSQKRISQPLQSVSAIFRRLMVRKADMLPGGQENEAYQNKQPGDAECHTPQSAPRSRGSLFIQGGWLRHKFLIYIRTRADPSGAASSSKSEE